MRVSISLFLFFLALCFAVPAQACIVGIYNPGPQYSYGVYKPDNNRPDNLTLVLEADFLGVVRPFIVPDGRVDLKPDWMESNYYRRSKNLAWREVQFRLLDVLKGRGDWNQSKMYPFVEDENFPLASNTDRALDLGFWETLKLRIPKTKRVGPENSCGEIYGEERLLPSRDYLIAAKGSEILFALVVDGVGDPLITEFKNIVSDQKTHAMRLSPEDYFGQMAGYVHFKMKRCASTKDLYGQGDEYWNSNAKAPKYDKLKKQRRLYRIIDSSSSDLPLIDVRDILAFGRAIDRYYDVDCEKGQEYLAITRPDQASYRGPDWTSPITHKNLPHRYLMIEDGKVNLDKFLSNIQINPAALVDADQVKAWIKEGREAARDSRKAEE